MKLLLDKYEMASAPTQKHLSGLSEGGVEGFRYFNTCTDVTADFEVGGNFVDARVPSQILNTLSEPFIACQKFE